jgi:hypothetical protein
MTWTFEWTRATERSGAEKDLEKDREKDLVAVAAHLHVKISICPGVSTKI